jgi:hypothetical protein
MHRLFLVSALVCFGALAAPDCSQECNQRLKDKTKICDDLFNIPGSAHYHDTEWHKDCLVKAKNDYDNCLSTCKP